MNCMIFYWIDVMDKLQNLFFVVLVLSLTAAFGFFLMWVNEAEELEDMSKETFHKILITLIIVMVISLNGVIFIPSKNCMYKMLITKYTTSKTLKILDNKVKEYIKILKEK